MSHKSGDGAMGLPDRGRWIFISPEPVTRGENSRHANKDIPSASYPEIGAWLSRASAAGKQDLNWFLQLFMQGKDVLKVFSCLTRSFLSSSLIRVRAYIASGSGIVLDLRNQAVD